METVIIVLINFMGATISRPLNRGQANRVSWSYSAFWDGVQGLWVCGGWMEPRGRGLRVTKVRNFFGAV